MSTTVAVLFVVFFWLEQLLLLLNSSHLQCYLYHHPLARLCYLEIPVSHFFFCSFSKDVLRFCFVSVWKPNYLTCTQTYTHKSSEGEDCWCANTAHWNIQIKTFKLQEHPLHGCFIHLAHLCLQHKKWEKCCTKTPQLLLLLSKQTDSYKWRACCAMAELL